MTTKINEELKMRKHKKHKRKGWAAEDGR